MSRTVFVLAIVAALGAPAVAEQHPASSGAQVYDEAAFDAMSDAEFARFALGSMTGHMWQASNTTSFAGKEAQSRFEERANALLASLNADGALAERYCAELKELVPDRACDYSDDAARFVWHSRKNEAMFGAVLSVLAERVGDSALSAEVEGHFVATFGYSHTIYTWQTDHGKVVGYLLRELSPKDWAQWQLRYAAGYARRYNVPEEAYASLASFVRERPKCHWYLVAVEKPYKGGGRYGSIRVADQGELVRSSLDLKGGIKCADIKNVKSDRQALRVAKKGHKPARAVRAAHFVDDYDWMVRRRNGVPVRQTHLVKVYADGEEPGS